MLVPYLKAKLDSYHKQLKERLPRPASRAESETADSNGQSSVRVFFRRLKQFEYLYSLKKAFVKTYPFAHFAYEGSFFLYQVRRHAQLICQLNVAL